MAIQRMVLSALTVGEMKQTIDNIAALLQKLGKFEVVKLASISRSRVSRTYSTDISAQEIKAVLTKKGFKVYGGGVLMKAVDDSKVVVNVFSGKKVLIIVSRYRPNDGVKRGDNAYEY